jgi:ATP-dependent Clp protease protease subunit
MNGHRRRDAKRFFGGGLVRESAFPQGERTSVFSLAGNGGRITVFGIHHTSMLIQPKNPGQNSGPATPSNAFYNIPYVIEKTGRGEKEYDIFSRLLKDRIVFLGTPIDDYVANAVIAQLLFLQMDDPKKDVHIYINSPGGSVTAGLAIYDTMQFLTCDVTTYCLGMAASMGAVLLAAGTKGKRYALPNSDIMIHQVSGGASGTASDVERTVEYMFKLKKRLIKILALHTGKDEETVKRDSDRDYYMTSFEARDYGLVDQVVQSRKDVKVEAGSGGEVEIKAADPTPSPASES